MRDPQQHPIDHLFEQGLKDARIKAPAKAWEGIAAAMETKRLRRKVFFARMTAAASLALLIGFGAWFYFLGRYPATDRIVFSTAGHPAQHGGHFAPVPEQDCQTVPQPQVLASKANSSYGIPASQATRIIRKLEMEFLHTKRVEFGGSANISPGKVLRVLHDLNPATAQSLIPFPALEEMEKPAPTLQANEDFMAEFEPKHFEEHGGRKHSFSLGGTAAPDFTFASQTPVSLGRVNHSSKNALPEDATDAFRTYTPVTAFTTGLNMGYDVTKRVAVNSGVYYTNRKSDRDHAIVENGQAEAAQTNFDVSFLEIPATVSYKFIDRARWSSFVSAGMSANLFVQYNNSFETDSGINARKLSDKSDALTPAQTNLLLSAGTQVKLSERISLTLEPRFRYGVVTTDYAFSQSHPVSLAAFSGIHYKF